MKSKVTEVLRSTCPPLCEVTTQLCKTVSDKDGDMDGQWFHPGFSSLSVLF